MRDEQLRELERKILAGDAAALEEFKVEWLRRHAVRDEVVRAFQQLEYNLGEAEAAHSREWKRVQELETMRGSCVEYVESATFRNHAARLERIRLELRSVPDCLLCRDRGPPCVRCGRGFPSDPVVEGAQAPGHGILPRQNPAGP